MTKFNKKRNKGWGWFVQPKSTIYINPDAGNVPYNNAVFNSNMGAGDSASSGEAMAEGIGDKLTPKSPRVFIETASFRKRWKLLNLTDEDLRKLQNDILTLPPEADLGKGLFKFRFSPDSSSRGLSGSNRVIYLDIIASETNVLLYIFAKNELSDLTSGQKIILKAQADELRKEYDR